jgi:hypothetical protein
MGSITDYGISSATVMMLWFCGPWACDECPTSPLSAEDLLEQIVRVWRTFGFYRESVWFPDWRRKGSHA